MGLLPYQSPEDIDFVWPAFETETFDDEQIKQRLLAFLAQFNCADFARFDKDRLLPRTGVLSFFYELGLQQWGFDPHDKGCARVFWFEDVENLSSAPFPDALEDNWQLLFQLNTVAQDNFELMFGDCGRIYFYSEGRFDSQML